jgi:Peptidase_C39 like family
MTRRLLLLVCAAAVLGLVGTAPALAAQNYPLNYKTFDLTASSQGTSGTVFSGGSLGLASSGTGSLTYADTFANYSNDHVDGSGVYKSGTWTSAVTPLSFGFNELVSSWNANTPPKTWVQVEVQPQMDDGHWAKWYILGQWSSDDYSFHRTSVGGQGDADGFVSIDTLFTKDHPAIAYRLRATLYRKIDATAGPTLSRLSAVASNLTNQKGAFPSKTTMNGTSVDLGVPQYSQEIHHGDFPQYDNGGEAWCSPTSTAMVVGYWSLPTVTPMDPTDYSPTSTEYSWVTAAYPPPHQDPWVDFTARAVYDYHYNGAGNWPFNAAYAASRTGLVADVTQLHNLREAEPFIKKGIPLVASVAWNSNKLDGGIKSTNGHLLVIEGFSADGSKVIVNDPASLDDSVVKHFYDREQFERAWIPASGGIVYVIRPVGWPTPVLTQNNS